MTPTASDAAPPLTLDARTQRTTKNVLVSVGTQIISWALSFYVGIYLAGYLGDQNYGRLEFAGAFVVWLDVLVPLGTSPVLVKRIARVPDDTFSLIRAALVLRMGLGLLLGVGLVAVVTLLHYGPLMRGLVAVMAAGTVVVALGDVLASALQGQEKMARQSAAVLIEKFLFSGLTLFFITLHANLMTVATVTIFTGLVSLCVNLSAFRGLRGQAEAVSATTTLWADARRLALAGLPFLGWLLFRTLYGQTDKLVLGVLTTLSDVAWYGVAFKLAGSAMFFPTAISTAMLPPLSILYAQDNKDEFARMARRMLSLVLFLGVPCGLIFFAIPDRLLGLTHLPLVQFGGTIPVLRIGGLATILWFAAIALGTTVIASDGQTKMFRASVFAAIVGVPACILFSLYTRRAFGNGAMGAIASDVLVEMLLIFCYLRAAPPGVWNGQTLWEAGRFVLAAIPLALLLLLPVFAGWGWLGVFFGGTLYVAACVLLGAVPLSEVRKLLRR